MIFSVVIPVYNVKDYLPKCIDSVLAQDFEDYEVILIDDGSTDGESGAICDRYAAAHPERIRAIHKPNGGVGEARNVGIEAAQGEYLIFIDSDDYIAPDMFRVLADAVARFGSDIHRLRRGARGRRRRGQGARGSPADRPHLHARRHARADADHALPLEPHLAAQPVSGFRRALPGAHLVRGSVHIREAAGIGQKRRLRAGHPVLLR